uniref:Mitochondrial peroxiredoxin PRX1 n=1 Tax=Ganoderma boninense TaxID=34458 RepID=A0A5K1K677_9APHY|nr:Mitochondrial peroxiredoxin PRX1 [Ganoderma boninense]
MRFDAHYPSFTSVMASLDPSLRLPTYRSSYTARFHPYPRGGPRRTEDMPTDGHPAHAGGPPSSNSEPPQPRIVRVFCRLWMPVWSSAESPACHPIFLFPTLHLQRPTTGRFAALSDNADVESFELDLPVVGVDYDEDELRAAGIPTGLSRSKLSSLLSVSADAFETEY